MPLLRLIVLATLLALPVVRAQTESPVPLARPSSGQSSLG